MTSKGSRLAWPLGLGLFALAACTSAGEAAVAEPASTPTIAPLATVVLTPTPAPDPTATPVPTAEPREFSPPSNNFIQANSAIDVLKESLRRTALMGSYHYELRMTLTPRSSGQSLVVPLTVEGDFQQPDDFKSIRIVTLAGVNITSHEIMSNGEKFETDPATSLWQSAAGSATPAGEAVDFLSITPDDLSDIEVLGSGSLEGVNVYRIRATAPAGLIGDSPSPVELNYWLGIGDLVIRQVSADGVIAWPEADLLLGSGAGGISAVSMTMNLSGFGRPADIQAPDSSLVAVDLSEIEVVTAAGFPLADGRVAHAASLLVSGEVIVIGGTTDPNTLLASTEIYDPVTGRWSSGGDLAGARTLHTATTLLDGRLLVVGGSDREGTLGSAEIMDPATREWSPAGTLSVPRELHTATLLSDGRVLIVGGFAASEVFAAVEIYDPGLGAWFAVNDLAEGRLFHTATLLADGRVLVAGGVNSLGDVFTDAEIYDPGLDSWTAVAPKLVPVSSHGAALLQDGRVLMAGGVTAGAIPVRTAEIYDPATDAWTPVSPPNDNHISVDPVLLDDGTVLFVAGGNRSGTWATIEVYDPAADEWTVVGKLTVARGLHTSVLLNNGLVLIAGGGDNDGTSNSVELFDSVTRTVVPANLSIDLSREYEARFTLPVGEFTVQLFAQDAPITVDNFVMLARDGFYDGLTFHSVRAGFLAESGDPLDAGRADTGFAIPDEFSERKHDSPGVLSMFNVGPNTGRSQFFITYVPLSALDGVHTVFGKVIEGMDVVRQIPERDPRTATEPGMTITRVEIVEK